MGKYSIKLIVLGIFSSVIFGCMLIGCGKLAETTSGPEDKTPNHFVPWENGIAGISINMTSAEIITNLGAPEKYALRMFNELKYRNIGTFHLDDFGKVDYIYQHSYVHSSFPPTNVGRISVLSPENMVLESYGTPDAIKYSNYDKSIVKFTYEYWRDEKIINDVYLEIDFFSNKTVHSIHIFR